MKRNTDYIQLRPYRAIAAPKLVPQRQRDQLSYGVKTKRMLATAVQTVSAPVPRGRLVYAGMAVAVLVVGLAWRSQAAHLPRMMAKYGGDALWAAMVFAGFGFLRPKHKTWKLAGLAFTFASLIEFSQLYHAPWIDELRETSLGALVLGSVFNWPDFAAYAAGIAAAAIAESLLRSRPDTL